jgi:hypothetical protein
VRVDDLFEPCPLASQILRALAVAPHPGILQLAPDFGQTLLLLIDVKDTS